MVTSKQLRLAVETEEDRRAKLELPNNSGWPLRQAMKEKQDWRRWYQPPAQVGLGDRKKEEQKKKEWILDFKNIIFFKE